MKTLTENQALRLLQKLKTDYREFVRENYEHRARSCETCPAMGACCLDAHFVNVHISTLEAVAIVKTLSRLNEERQREIYGRIAETVEKYDLKADCDSFAKTYACPLFEKSTGCLVHETGKPAPCISHACYENRDDLPPENLQGEVEDKIERLNKRAYGNNWNYFSLPVALDLMSPFGRSD